MSVRGWRSVMWFWRKRLWSCRMRGIEIGSWRFRSNNWFSYWWFNNRGLNWPIFTLIKWASWWKCWIKTKNAFLNRLNRRIRLSWSIRNWNTNSTTKIISLINLRKKSPLSKIKLPLFKSKMYPLFQLSLHKVRKVPSKSWTWWLEKIWIESNLRKD